MTLFAKDTSQKCIFVIITDGFEEVDTIVILSALRQAGLCVKSIALTSGLIGGAHGVWLMPDLTLGDVDRLLSTTAISQVILPEGEQSLARLQADPRVHKLLRQVVAQQGQIVTTPEGLQVLRAAGIWINESKEIPDDQKTPVLLRDLKKSPTAFAENLIRKQKILTT